MTSTLPGLVVNGETADYVIEPLRHRMDLTRVEMVDVHLARLTAKGRGASPDVDALLDARTRYQLEETP